MSSQGADRTEKATPKKREQARKEGQVARSMEINSAFAILASFGLLLIWGPKLWRTLSEYMYQSIISSSTVELTQRSVMEIFFSASKVVILSIWPFLLGLAVVGVIANVVQVKFKVTPEVIKPRLSKINPINGLKQKFSVHTLFEFVKNIIKLIVIGGPAAHIVWKARGDLLALGGAEPVTAAQLTMSLIFKVGFTVGVIYIALALGDYLFQRHRHEKQLRMTKQEVKQEMRQQDMSPEMKGQQRRRQREAARRRMLADVPQADVIITNPTHFAIALKYDPEEGAPRVLAKGADLLAKRIREIAAEAGVMRVENKPLARSMYDQVEVGSFIPADLFTAVAEVLAFVYRAERRKGRSSERTLEHA